ncbi:MAG TPA: hypothetical protein VF230_01915 [Acidimicrobiales bacterium]
MRTTRTAWVARLAAAALLLSAAACQDKGASRVELDGSPRRADVAGVVTEVSSSEVTIDGKTYDVADDLQCFSASTLASIPLAARKGTYVHVGLDGDTVTWLAGYSAVVEFPERGELAFHTGDLVEVEDGKATFKDGSVLEVADIEAPPDKARVTAEIDVKTDKVTRFLQSIAGVRPAVP